MHEEKKRSRIRAANDRLRVTGQGGQVVVTRGIIALGERDLVKIMNAVSAFNDFSEENDPWGEHDLGMLDIGGQRIIWKIDYYDPDLVFASPDPADPAVTVRVLTVMLAEEY